MPKNPFWNADERRLRAAWRIGLQFGLFSAVLLGTLRLPALVGADFGAAIIESLVYLAGGVASVWAMARWVDRRRMADFGLHIDRRFALDLALGLALGAVMQTGIFLTEKRLGWVEVVGGRVTSFTVPFGAALAVNAFAWLAIGINEELVFRGYQLKNLAEGLTGPALAPRKALAVAVLFTSIAFGAAHMANPGATPLSTLNIVVAGLLLSLPVVLTGELALSIGLHTAWNFFEGAVFGFAVSGQGPTTHAQTIQQTGPALWTGGDFGPEGGLLAVVWMLIVAALIVAWSKLRPR